MILNPSPLTTLPPFSLLDEQPDTVARTSVITIAIAFFIFFSFLKVKTYFFLGQAPNLLPGQFKINALFQTCHPDGNK
jgi:hypothetical protein